MYGFLGPRPPRITHGRVVSLTRLRSLRHHVKSSKDENSGYFFHDSRSDRNEDGINHFVLPHIAHVIPFPIPDPVKVYATMQEAPGTFDLELTL